MADTDDTLWQIRLGKEAMLADALDAMRLDRNLTRPEMVRSILRWAVDQKQRDCKHDSARRVEGRCGSCGALTRPALDF